MHHKFGFTVLLALSAGCATNPHVQPPAECTQEFEVPLPAAIRTLEVRAANGRVSIEHGTAAACRITACARASTHDDAQRLARQLCLQADDDPDDGIRVVAVQSPESIDMENINVFVAVTAPADLPVRVLTRRAAVMVHGYRGRLGIDTDSGDVTARLDGGAAEIKSRSGAVRLSGSFASAQVRAEAGAVRVVVPPEPNAPDIDVQTQAGDITVEVAQDSRVAFSARVRHARTVPCDLAATWSDYGVDAGDRWRSYRGTIGVAVDATSSKSTVHVVTETGRIAVRLLPGS